MKFRGHIDLMSVLEPVHKKYVVKIEGLLRRIATIDWKTKGILTWDKLTVKITFTDKTFLSGTFIFSHGHSIEPVLLKRLKLNSLVKNDNGLENRVELEKTPVAQSSWLEIQHSLQDEVKEILQMTRHKPMTSDQMLRVEQIIKIIGILPDM